MTRKALLFGLLFGFPLWAQSARRGAFAHYGLDAAAMGVGGAVTAWVSGPSAAFWNPAGVAFTRDQAFLASYGKFGALPLHVGFLAYAQPDEGFGAAALSWSYTGLKLYDGQDSWNEHTLGYTLAKSIGSVLGLGFQVKYLVVGSSLEGGNARGWGLDLGVQLHPLPYLALGGVVWDLLSRLTWDTETREALPPIVQVGISGGLPERFRLGLDLTGTPGFFPSDLRAGAEGMFLGQRLILRGGLVRKYADGRFIPTGGFGVRFSSMGVRYTLDYAFFGDPGGPGPVHRFSLTGRW